MVSPSRAARRSTRIGLSRRAVSAGSVWAPSPGSGTTMSTTPRAFWSAAVIFIARAAVGASSAVRHRIAAQPSGEMTE